MRRIATLADAQDIHASLKTAQVEILNVPLKEVQQAIIQGRCVWDKGVGIIWRRLEGASYYGVKLPRGAYQILQLVAVNKGDGSAPEVFGDTMRAFGTTTFLLVKSDNERAIRFYTRMGFIKAKTISFPTFNSDLMVRTWKP